MSAPAPENIQAIAEPNLLENPNDSTAINKELLEKIAKLEAELAAKNKECEEFKVQNSRLELDLVEANMRNSQNVSEAGEVHKMKQQSEEVLTRAKSIIFEKTKICKNQELQIEALNAQVTSLRDVVSITKNMLEIRNMEVKHLQDQIDCMNAKVEAERERQNLIHSKLEKMIRMNADLKREYETQLCLFNALRDRYSERELAKGVVNDMREANAAEAIATNSPPVNGETSTIVTTEATALPKEVTVTNGDVSAATTEAKVEVNGEAAAVTTEAKVEVNGETATAEVTPVSPSTTTEKQETVKSD